MPMPRSSASVRDLVASLQAMPDEAFSQVLSVWIDTLGWVPGGRLDDLEEKTSYRLTQVLLGRATEVGFQHWCNAFPIQAGDHLSGWHDELARAQTSHTWSAEDDHVSHHEHDQSALQCATAVQNFGISRPWAMAAVIRQELALQAVQGTRPGSAYGGPIPDAQMVLDRVIRAWGLRLQREAPTGDPVPARLEKSRQAFAKLTRAAWRQVEEAARLTGRALHPEAFFGPAPSRQFPLAEQRQGWPSSPGPREGWEQAAAIGQDLELSQRLLAQLRQLPAADQSPILLRWFDAAARHGALPILDLLLRHTPVLDVPALPDELAHGALVSSGERLRDHLRQVSQHPQVAGFGWSATAVAFLTSHQRQAELNQAPPVPGRSPRRRA